VPVYHAITLRGNGLLNVLITPCHVCAAHNPNGPDPKPTPVEFNAIWDTGATGSVITQKVVDACGLQPTGMTHVRGVAGISVSEKYLINLNLNSNAIRFPSVEVTKGELGEIDVLIGMDVIATGDFSVTNANGVTVFSFRIPSQKHIDYVAIHTEETRKEKLQSLSRAGKQDRKKRHKKFGKKK
jgi:hypothetical protein